LVCVSETTGMVLKIKRVIITMTQENIS
jgi:hypothetical protein